MPEFGGPGKMLIVLGLGIAAVGLVILLTGRLPGDLLIKREHFTLYLPLGTCILISVAGSVLLYFIMKR